MDTGYGMIRERPVRFAPGFPRCTCVNGNGCYVRRDLIDAWYAMGRCDRTGFIPCRRHSARPRSKQETPEYVEPFDVQADWEERA